VKLAQKKLFGAITMVKQNVLVTGGAGYIGSHTCKSLATAGYRPIAYDDLSEGHASAVRWGPLITADIADREALSRTVERYEISQVIHFAASAYVGESIINPRKYFNNNFAKTLSMLDCLLDSDVKSIVLSSTCATYGLPERLPIKEDHRQQPINPYGESKLAIERLLYWYGRSYELKWVALRYFNAAGADPDGDIGESHRCETHIIPLALQAAAGALGYLSVFGADYPTSDGTAVRDFIHVLDLANAHVLALEYLSAGQPSCALNLGTGIGYSVREVISKIEQVIKCTVPYHVSPRRTGDPAVLVADADLAEATLGWKPRHSELAEIIKTAWRWQTELLGDRDGLYVTAASDAIQRIYPSAPKPSTLQTFVHNE
jgi:UDP-arabinose 4-epimerase